MKKIECEATQDSSSAIKDKNTAGMRTALLLLFLWLAQWLLWGTWQNFAVPKLPNGAFTALLGSIVIKGIIWAALPLPVLLIFRKKKLIADSRKKESFPWLILVMLICITAVFLYTVRIAHGLVNTHTIFDPMFLVFSLTAGIYEEFAFRGVLFRLQESALGLWPAALLNGAMFALYHYPGLLFGESFSLLISWRGLLLFVMGVLFSLIFWKWRRISLNMTVHTVWDILTYLFCLAG